MAAAMMLPGCKVRLTADFNPWAPEDETRSCTVKEGTLGVVQDVELSPSLPSIRKGTVLVDFKGVQWTRYVFPSQIAYLEIVSPATRNKTRRRTREEDAPPDQENGAQATARTGRQDAPEARRFKQFRGTDLTQDASNRGLTSIQLTCKNDKCPYGKTFEMKAAEQVFAMKTFNRRGTAMPKWCPGCRVDRKARHAKGKR